MANINSNGNGTSALIKQLIVVVSALAILIFGYAASRANSAVNELHDHERKTGHPVLTTRVDRVEEDIAEIKTDIKAINGAIHRIENNLTP